MKVQVLYFDDCPNQEPLLARLRAIVARERSDCDVELVRVESDEEARRVGFLGSPTVRVDGHDVEPGAATRHDFALKCRLYRTPDGLVGTPPDEWIARMLRDGAEDSEHGG